MILLLLNYLKLKVMDGQYIGVAIIVQGLEGFKFIFTKRTRVRLGVSIYLAK